MMKPRRELKRLMRKDVTEIYAPFVPNTYALNENSYVWTYEYQRSREIL